MVVFISVYEMGGGNGGGREGAGGKGETVDWTPSSGTPKVSIIGSEQLHN